MVINVVGSNYFIKTNAKNVTRALCFGAEITIAEKKPQERRDSGHVLVENIEANNAEAMIGSYLFPKMIDIDSHKGRESLSAKERRNSIIFNYCGWSQIVHDTD